LSAATKRDVLEEFSLRAIQPTIWPSIAAAAASVER